MFDTLGAERRYVLKFTHQVRLSRPGGWSQSFPAVQGELQFKVTKREEDAVGFELQNYSFTGALEAADDRCVFVSIGGSGKFVRAGDEWALSLRLRGLLLSARPSEEAVIIPEDGVYALGLVANANRNQVAGDVIIAFGAWDPTASGAIWLEVRRSTASLAPVDTGLENDGGAGRPAPSLDISVTAAQLLAFDSPSEEGQIRVKTLPVHPILVVPGVQHEASYAAQLALYLQEANRIWGKGCIHFEETPGTRQTHLASALLQQTGKDNLIDAIRSWQPQPLNDGIALFVMDPAQLATALGGGDTPVRFDLSANGDLILVVLRILVAGQAGNDHLLAHELGHALAGVHPNRIPSEVQWRGADNAILTPSSIAQPNNDRNTQWNCEHARHPMLVTTDQWDSPHYDL